MSKLYMFDGAFGTYYRKLFGDAELCEKANLTHPERVLTIHRAYLEAGAQAVKTNTFAANRFVYGNEKEREELVRAGYRLAKEAASSCQADVFADIGGLSASPKAAEEEYLSLTDLFLSCGADRFLFETMDDIAPLKASIERIREERPEAVVIVSFAVSEDGYTASGFHYRRLLKEAHACGCNAVGLNCVCGPTHMHSLIRALGRVPYRLSAMPNAGYPSKNSGRLEYRDNPNYFAEQLRKLASLGVDFLGGCCGTTPEHIRAALDRLETEPIAVDDVLPADAAETAEGENRLFDGHKLIAAELNPPLDADVTFFRHAAEVLKEKGADLLTFTDSPLARARADSVMMAAKIKREVGIETMPHIACRDRNRIALKSAFLAAHIERVNTFLVVTGDAIRQPPIPKEGIGEKAVYSFDSTRLLSYIQSLNEEVFVSEPIRCAAALNVNARRFDVELERAVKKEEAGASFFLTQAIFSAEAVDNLKKAHETLESPILAGILPLAGYKNAVFLNNEVGGIDIPDRIVESLKDKSTEEMKEISLAYCRELIGMTKDFCSGYYLMMPLKRLDLVSELLEYIKKEVT